jgi:hypothetical protein
MVMEFVRVDISMPAMWFCITESTVTVADVFSPVFSMTAVSCANGKLSVLTPAPELAAQALADQLPPAAKFQYTVLGVLKVIPLQPLKSPTRVPLMGAAVPMT